MFAYCGNNPSTMFDPTGYDYDPATVRRHLFYVDITHTYGGFTQYYYSSGCEWLNDIQQKIDNVLESFNSADSIEDYVGIGQSILEDERIANTIALYKIPSGINKIRNGLGILMLPIPTFTDEILGGVQIAWGFSSIVTGVGELFEWEGD